MSNLGHWGVDSFIVVDWENSTFKQGVRGYKNIARRVHTVCQLACSKQFLGSNALIDAFLSITEAHELSGVLQFVLSSPCFKSFRSPEPTLALQ